MKKTITKGRLHQKNIHKGKYDFKLLIENDPSLKRFTKRNPRGDVSVDFSDNKAVLALNKALLKTYYNIEYWDIPKGFLCPPIPGRADYIHYAAELIDYKEGAKVLDIGTGANCIYPILGSQSYNWNFTASDTEKKSIENAKKIIDSNENLKDKIVLKQQNNKDNFFKGIIEDGEHFDLTICNPPFFSSKDEAVNANRRKINNLSRTNINISRTPNFGGQSSELWCRGGEKLFLKKMIKESADFANQVTWFTSLVSDKDNLYQLKKILTGVGVKDIKILNMSQGQKVSRVLAWTFMDLK